VYKFREVDSKIETKASNICECDERQHKERHIQYGEGE
jgi:hypothetical protein